jgi:hypothetical protein
LTADKLAISGAMPPPYIKWLEAVKKFYGLASTDTDIQSKLARLKITADDFTAANTAIADLWSSDKKPSSSPESLNCLRNSELSKSSFVIFMTVYFLI